MCGVRCGLLPSTHLMIASECAAKKLLCNYISLLPSPSHSSHPHLTPPIPISLLPSPSHSSHPHLTPPHCNEDHFTQTQTFTFGNTPARQPNKVVLMERSGIPSGEMGGATRAASSVHHQFGWPRRSSSGSQWDTERDVRTHQGRQDAEGKGPCELAVPSLRLAGWPGEECGKGLGRREVDPWEHDWRGLTGCNGTDTYVVFGQVSGYRKSHSHDGPFAGWVGCLPYLPIKCCDAGCIDYHPWSVGGGGGEWDVGRKSFWRNSPGVNMSESGIQQ